MRSAHSPRLAALAVVVAMLVWQTLARQPSVEATLPLRPLPRESRPFPHGISNANAPQYREYAQESFADPGTALFFLCVGDPAATYEVVLEGRGTRVTPRFAAQTEVHSSWTSDCVTEDFPSSQREPEDFTTVIAQVGRGAPLPTSVRSNEDRPFRLTRRFSFPKAGSRSSLAAEELLESDLLAENPHIRVYVERGTTLEASFDGFLETVCELAGAVVTGSDALGGQCRDVDADGKLSIVLTSRLSEFGGRGGRLDGCVRWEDFQDFAPRSVGNAADVIFLNPEVPDRAQLFAVLAHEYGHLIAFTRRGIGLDPTAVPDEDWLNEALAHVIEVQLSGQDSNLADRIDEFLRHPEQSPLVVASSTRSGLWRDPGSRGAGYLFLEWLVRRSPEERLARLLRGPERGTQLVEAVSGTAFGETWSAWAAHLWSQGIPQRREGTARRYPAAVDVELSRHPLRIAVRGMSLCYLSAATHLPGGTIAVTLPADAIWLEGWAQRDRVVGAPLASDHRDPQYR